MERFCQYVIEKVSVDYENEQLKDMTEALVVMLDRFVQSLQKEHPDYIVEKVVKCGSMAEQTRITTDGIDYDYLVILKHDSNIPLKHPCPDCKYEGCVKIFHENRETEIISGKMKAEFHNTLLETIKNNCRHKPWHKSCEYCFESTNTGNLKLMLKGESNTLSPTKLTFLWTPHKNDSDGISLSKVNHGEGLYERELITFRVKNKPQSARRTEEAAYTLENPDIGGFSLTSDRATIEPDLKFEVDFHPVLKLDMSMLDAESKFDPSHKYFLFPKGSSGCSGWRISTYEAELDVLQRTSDNHRKAFMFLKFIFEQTEVKEYSYITSYDLKTGILHHIIRCDAENTNQNLSKCITDVINFLSQSFFNQRLLNFVLRTNLIYSNENLRTECPVAKIRCDSTGYVLQVLGEKLSADENTDPEIILKRLSIIRVSVQRLSGYYILNFDLEKFKEEFDKQISKSEQFCRM